MSDSVNIIAVLGAATAFVGAIAAAAVSIISALRDLNAKQAVITEKVEDLAARGDQRAGQVDQKLSVIHDLTNSTLAAAKAALAHSEAENQILKADLAKERGEPAPEPPPPRDAT